MNAWEALLLGVVQGATEFLPVSSSGHLVIFQAVLGVSIDGVLFEVVVHVATLLSIVLVYARRIGGILGGMARRETEAWHFAGLLAVATVPAAVVGLLWKDQIEALFESPAVPGYALMVTGLLLWSTRGRLEKAIRARPGLAAAIAIGVAQAFALIPGISRSGSTVVTALWLGVQAPEAAAFSFLMAVPAIAGAAVLQVPELSAGAGPSTAALLLGGLAAAVTGVLAIRTFVAMLKRRSFHYFAPYCWLVGVAYLLFLGLR